MTTEAERLTRQALDAGIDPVCKWCGKPYSTHADKWDPEHATRMPCGSTKEFFLPRGDSK